MRESEQSLSSGRERRHGHPRASGRKRHGDERRGRGNLCKSKLRAPATVGSAGALSWWARRLHTVPPGVSCGHTKTCNCTLAKLLKPCAPAAELHLESSVRRPGTVNAPMATERSRTIWRRSICVQPLAPHSLLSNAFNGSTYASNRFEGHFEIDLRGVESVAARRAGCGSWWRSPAHRLKLAMSGVTILAFGCKHCKHTTSQHLHLNRG
jgi:hypothetical protein